MAKYPAQLQSANLNEFGIVYADEVQGHKTVATLSALYAITDPILSKSVVNTGNDAIGQEWYVISEGCYYRLDNWANRHTASGWTKIQVVDTEFNSLSTHGADKIKNFTTSSDTVTLNYNTWKSSTSNQDGSTSIPAATQSNAGVLSAKDKTELDRINTANFSLGAVTPESTTVEISANKTNITDNSSVPNNITIPAATQSKAGVISAADKTKVDRVTGTNHVLLQPTTTDTSRTITITGINPTNNSPVSSSITLPEVSETQAGLASASDKKTLNAIKTLKNSSHLNDETCWSKTASDVSINFTCTDVSGNSGDTSVKSEHSVGIGAVTSTLAGVMTAADKVKLDTTLPNLINEEVKNRQEQIRSISGVLGFTENPTNIFHFSPENKDLSDKDTVTKAIDFLADEKYRSEMPDDLTVPNNIGGLKAGKSAKELKTKSISQILDDILFPELQPSVTAPSASISLKSGFSNGQILEVGSNAPVNPTNFTTGYSQGSSRVVGQVEKKRGGVLISGSSFIYYNTPSTTTLPSKVVLGTMSYKYRAAYQQGEVCITSKGNKASLTPNPLPAGTVDSGAVTIYGTYPFFCNGANASSSSQDTAFPSAMSDIKLPLVTWTTTLIGAKFASEASTGTRITFDFPSAKRVTKVEFMNTVSGKWENFPGYSTSSLGNKTVQGASVAYSRLTTTGALSGAIQLRFTIANA